MHRSAATAPYRVLLVDDHQIIRDSLDVLLGGDPRFEVVGQADNGIDAVRQGQQLQPHLMVIDMDLPGLGGLEVMHQLRGLMAHPPAFIVLSMFGDPQLAGEALSQGALGYVHKSSGLREVQQALAAVAAGETYLCPRIRQAVGSLPAAPDEPRLTARERDVLRCIAMGLNAKETARKLDIAPATVHVFRANLRSKLGARSQADLVRAGIRLGLSGIQASHFD
jgi:DNA-binding NarL/FixJ family response regulator